MTFCGIGKRFSLRGEEQYETIGAFWDELAAIYGLECLQGLGYGWSGDTMEYAIGLKDGEIEGWNLCIALPEQGWHKVCGRTNDLKELYDEIYREGPLTYEIETFNENGDCTVIYCREP